MQADLLSELSPGVVVALVRASEFGRRAIRLHPVFVVAGQELVMETHLVAAVRVGTIGACVASLQDQRETIIGAIDVLWSGV